MAKKPVLHLVGGFLGSGKTTAIVQACKLLAESGLRLRAGPSTAYPVLANPLRYTVFPVLGRTANNAWLQVNFNGTHVANLNVVKPSLEDVFIQLTGKALRD